VSRRQLTACIILLALGLAFAGWSCLERIRADRDYSSVMVLVDWHALNSVANTAIAGEDDYTDHWEYVAQFDDAMVCYGEETVGSLLDQGIITPAWVTSGAPSFMVVDDRFAGDIARGADRHGYAYANNPHSDGRLVVQFPDLPEEDLALLPVAWLMDVIEAVRESGHGLVLRPGGSEFLSAEGMKETLDFVSRQPLTLFQGPTVLGYPNQLGAVAQQLLDQQQYFGWVEFDEQDGGSSLAARLAPQVLRIHSIPPEEMVNYTVESAVARYIRAVRERGIRCIYVRPFIRGKVVNPSSGGYRASLHAVNLDYFTRLQDELTAAGFTALTDINYLGGPPASPPQPTQVISLLRPFFTTLAAGAAVVLLLAMWLPGWPKWVWTLLLVMTAVKGIAAIFVSMIDSAVLLAAALAFPLLGFWLALLVYQALITRLSCTPLCPRRLFIALVSLLVASVVTIAGGLVIHGGMWDAEAMLKVTQFRGVTLALAIPVLLLAAYAWKAETLNDAYEAATLRLTGFWQRFLELWQSPIRYGDVAFIMIALGAVGLVLMRSGNDNPLGMLSIEGLMRDSLEQWFSVRPRTKELVGHPLFIVFLLSLPWKNRLTLLFGIGALLGQVSILNTFCHLHTPLSLTVERVLIGLCLGIASGVVWGVVILVVGWLWGLVKQRIVAASPGADAERL